MRCLPESENMADHLRALQLVLDYQMSQESIHKGCNPIRLRQSMIRGGWASIIIGSRKTPVEVGFIWSYFIIMTRMVIASSTYDITP